MTLHNSVAHLTLLNSFYTLNTMARFFIEDILSPIRPAHPLERDGSSPASARADLRHLLDDVVSRDSGLESLMSSPASSAVGSTPTPSGVVPSSAPCSPPYVLTGAHLYSHLQQTLAQESYNLPWTLYASSPLVSLQDASSLAPREQQLQHIFSDAHLWAAYPHQMRELQGAYDNEMRRLVSEMQNSLHSVFYMPWLEQSITHYYQLQHSCLIDRVLHSLLLLQSTIQMPPPITEQSNFATSTPKKHRNRRMRSRQPLSERAVRIMEKWYKDNQEHPYPSYESCEVMAEAGDISVEQVKKWFANRRLRHRNTKSLGEIARRRKVNQPSMDLVNAAWKMANCS